MRRRKLRWLNLWLLPHRGSHRERLLQGKQGLAEAAAIEDAVVGRGVEDAAPVVEATVEGAEEEGTTVNIASKELTTENVEAVEAVEADEVAGAAAGGINEVATEDVPTGVVDADPEVAPTAEVGVAEGKEEPVAVVKGEATGATVATNATPKDTPVTSEYVIAEEAEAVLLEDIPTDDAPDVGVVTEEAVTEDTPGDLPIEDAPLTAVATADAPTDDAQPERVPVEGCLPRM